jgi:DNA excision repair protein ERCC-4
VADCLLPTTSVIDLPLLHLMVACAARQDLYKSGGILSVTSRILVVDLLHKRMPIELITGLVILHAET